MNKGYVILGATLCLTSIIMGAFGAHLIENNLGERAADIFDTAATYQMYHGLAIILITILMTYFQSSLFKKAIYFFLAGTICFSGSLYLLAFKAKLGSLISIIGPITPVGGLLFIIGWGLFILGVLHGRPVRFKKE